MRNVITLMAVVTMSTLTALPSLAQRAVPKRECLAFNPDGSCIVRGIDPYGPNRYQAQQHNACLAECNNSFQFCLMSYVQYPSPAEYCGRVRASCLRTCP